MVDFKGFVSDVYAYSESAQYIFTSRYLGILEALSMKRLVVAHYNNEIKKDYLYMAPFAKYIVIARNPEELSQKIAYYLIHPEKEKELISKAFSWVKNQSWEKMTDLYLKLWKK